MSSSVRSTRSLKLSLPKSTFSGTTSMPQRSRHCAGRSAVESVTTPNPRLLDAEDEGIVLLPAGLKLDLQAGETVSQGLREALDLGIRRLLSAVHGDQLEGLRTERIERFLGDLVDLVEAGSAEDVDQPLSGDDCDDPHPVPAGLRRLLLLGCRLVARLVEDQPVLLGHVVDLGLGQRAHAGGVAQDLGRVFGMD